jgi:hypothetical protein
MVYNPSLKTLDELKTIFEVGIKKTPKDVLNSIFFQF